MIRRGDIFRIRRESGDIVVCVADQPESDRIGVNCMVVGGTNPTYPKGSWDIHVFFSDLSNAERVKL